MSLERRLAHLEVTHRKILRCLWCQWALRDINPTGKQGVAARSDGLLATKCWYCGTPYIMRLASTDKYHREASELVYNSHPTKRYNDERVNAAMLWLDLPPFHKKLYEQKKREAAEKASRPVTQPTYQPPARLSPKERKRKEEREDLARRVSEFTERKQEEFKRRAQGPETFPLDEAIKALGDVPHSYDEELKDEAKGLGLEEYGKGYNFYREEAAEVRQFLLSLRKKEACELVIWRKVLPETMEEIAFFEALLPVLAERAQEIEREETEEKARREEERRREREARLNPQAVTQPAQPIAPDAAHVPSGYDFGDDEPPKDDFFKIVECFREAVRKMKRDGTIANSTRLLYEREKWRERAKAAPNCPPQATMILQSFSSDPDSQLGISLLNRRAESLNRL